MRYGSDAWDLAFYSTTEHEFMSDFKSIKQCVFYNLKRIEEIINQLELDKIEYRQITFGTPYSNNINYDAEISASKEAFDFLLSRYNMVSLYT